MRIHGAHLHPDSLARLGNLLVALDPESFAVLLDRGAPTTLLAGRADVLDVVGAATADRRVTVAGVRPRQGQQARPSLG